MIFFKTRVIEHGGEGFCCVRAKTMSERFCKMGKTRSSPLFRALTRCSQKRQKRDSLVSVRADEIRGSTESWSTDDEELDESTDGEIQESIDEGSIDDTNEERLIQVAIEPGVVAESHPDLSSGIMNSSKQAMNRKKGVVKPLTKLTKDDYSLICDWLENPKNAGKLGGAEKQVKLGSRPLVKAKAYAELAEFVNTHQRKGSTLKDVSGESMKTRFKSFHNRYRATWKQQDMTGWGLTAADLAANIDTVEAKLEKLCPCYHRMHKLFGSRPNVRPAAHHDTGVESEEGDFAWEDNTTSMGADSIPSNFVHPDSITEVAIDPQTQVEAAVDPQSQQEAATGNDDWLYDRTISSDDEVGDQQHTMENSVQAPASNNRGAQAREQSPHASEEVPSGEHSPEPLAAETPTGRRSLPTEVPTDDQPPVVETLTPTRRSVYDRLKNSAAPGNSSRRQEMERSQSLTRDTTYPAKKQVTESRHSMNVAFANNLDAQNFIKERYNELKERKIEREQAILEQKLEWEKQRYQEDKDLAKQRLERESKDKEEDRKECKEMARQQIELQSKDKEADRKERKETALTVAVLSSTRPVEEVQRLLSMLTGVPHGD